MKISGQIFQDTVNKVKQNRSQPRQVKPEERTEPARQDRVSIGSDNRPPENVGYSPDEIRADKPVETRADKIARLKEAVENKTYNVSTEKVAEKLAGAHINELI